MSSNYIHKLFTLLFTILWFIMANAAPARRNVITITQPDGSKLDIILVGNECCHYTETTDSIMVAKDSTDTWYYAIEGKEGNVTASNRIAHNATNRAQNEIKFLNGIDQKRLRDLTHSNTSNRTPIPQTKVSIHGQGIYSTTTFPTKGEVNGLVLLVDFPDRSFSLENNEIREKFNNILNQKGYKDSIFINNELIPGAYGSAKDYFESQSFGQFTPTFDVIGPITANNSYAYYGQNDSHGHDEVYAAEMVREITQKIHNNGLVDFSRYDNDNDMEIDFIYVIYAGKGENYTGADPYTIWPHQWFMESQLGNYWTGRYACSSELFIEEHTQQIDGIGTFCHEFSHILGLPDFYPTNISSGGSASTFKEWSVMDYGCYDNHGFTPVGYTALERYSLGWMNVVEITSPGEYTLPAIDTAQIAYLLPSDEKLSYILLETHNKEGWYQYQPAEGLLITSVDYNRSVWKNNAVNNNSKEQRYRVIAADNDYNESTKQGDLFPYNGNDSLTLYSNPKSITGCGIPVNIPIKNIKYSNGITTFSIIDRTQTLVQQPGLTTSNGLSYLISDNQIQLNSETKTKAVIYAATGKIVESIILQPNSPASITLPQKGVYLLRYNNRVIKITN